MFINELKSLNKVTLRSYCTKINSKSSYSHTIFLPKTKFPLRLTQTKLVERDKYVYNTCGFDNLYNWQRAHLSEPEFVLHDGPPYANGLPHMGHALNKILKDTILRYKILKGNKVHYIPGWDCHGLPIELKALKDSTQFDAIQIRNKARNFATKSINEQKQVFQSWGVLGDWKNYYTTYSKDYIKTELRQFLKLYKKNLIYRDIKPIYWSPSSRTALAEAELEYNDKHKSPSIYVKIKLIEIPKLGSLGHDCHIIIWTTTPWTLPANQCICYNESFSYSLVKNLKDNHIYLLGSDLISELSKTLETRFEILKQYPGKVLEGAVYEHPIYKNINYKLINSSHVSSSKGTGLVHSAGAHGPDDFLVALKNKLPLVDLVNDAGCYLSKAGAKFEGKFVLTEGNDTVINILKVNSSLLGLFDIVHSYPYDWRTNKPVIIKASQQWFIDTNSIKNKAIEILENVKFLPSDKCELYKLNLKKQIEKRPYWCISRQRKWGVPIPVLYNKITSENIINENTLNYQLNLLDTLGTDFWWKSKAHELLPKNLYQDKDVIEKCEDIMDIWFDSGLSWAKVLDGPKIADLYLEGVDQLTGWFQASLLTSVTLRDKSPFKTVYIHGFAVDENGIKMSKSIGNVVDPFEITTGKNALGIDTLRWWVTCHANQDAQAYVGKRVLQSSADEVNKIRSALRFAISTLIDYDKSQVNKQNRFNLLLIDRYMLHLLYCFQTKVSIFMEDYQFHRINPLLNNLLTNSVSALYYNAIKDRLYCDPLNSTARKSAQYTLYYIFETITQAVAPMLPHLVEELYLYHPFKENKTYFTTPHPKLNEEFNDTEVEKLFNLILKWKKDLNVNFGANIGDTFVEIHLSPEMAAKIRNIIPLNEFNLQLEDIFQVSKVSVSEKSLDKENYMIDLSKSSNCLCPRCRKYRSVKQNNLCCRCDNVIKNSFNKKVTN